MISGENKYSVGCLLLSLTKCVISCALHGPCNDLDGMIFIWWIAIHKSFRQCDLCLILKLHFVCSISCSGFCGLIVCSNISEEDSLRFVVLCMFLKDGLQCMFHHVLPSHFKVYIVHVQV